MSEAAQKDAMDRLLIRARYAAAQAARVAWYTGHYSAVRHISGPAGKVGYPPRASKFPLLDRKALADSFSELFRRDLANVEAGYYPLPEELRRTPNPLRLLRRSRAFLRDARAVARRKQARGHSEVLSEAEPGAYPRYYLQNFHFQSGGWITEDSARLYDMQVETLFTGAGGAMRRQAIPPLARAFAGRDLRGLRLLDLACGAGGFLADVKDAFPSLHVTGVDLSPAYIAEARRRLAGRRGATFVRGAAEAIPAGDAVFDAVTAVYLFHELPPKARAAAAAEIARVLRPGGVFVQLDTLQYGDDPRFDILLESFPHEFHEPYYDGYCREDLGERFAAAGLCRTGSALAFLSKVSVFVKKDAAP